jgi:hypothetical protein
MRFSAAISFTARKIFLCWAPVRGGLVALEGRDLMSDPPHSLIAPSAQRPQRLGWQASFDPALYLQTANHCLVMGTTISVDDKRQAELRIRCMRL